eukprot:gene12792-15637_t
MLRLLVEEAGRPVSRERFLDVVWESNAAPTTRTVDNQILSLRAKLESDPAAPQFIKTVHRLGCTLWAAEPDLKNLLQTGLMAEEADGDLAKAAGAYESLIQAGEGQQKLIATGLYRLAEVRRKQDKKEEAIQLYQRLVREFAGQELLVKLAKENLTTMG